MGAVGLMWTSLLKAFATNDLIVARNPTYEAIEPKDLKDIWKCQPMSVAV